MYLVVIAIGVTLILAAIILGLRNTDERPRSRKGLGKGGKKRGATKAALTTTAQTKPATASASAAAQSNRTEVAKSVPSPAAAAAKPKKVKQPREKVVVPLSKEDEEFAQKLSQKSNKTASSASLLKKKDKPLIPNVAEGALIARIKAEQEAEQKQKEVESVKDSLREALEEVRKKKEEIEKNKSALRDVSVSLARIQKLKESEKQVYEDKIAKLQEEIELTKASSTPSKDEGKSKSQKDKSAKDGVKTVTQIRQETGKNLSNAKNLRSDVAEVNAKIASLREALEASKQRRPKNDRRSKANQEASNDSSSDNANDNADDDYSHSTLENLQADQEASQKRIAELRSQVNSGKSGAGRKAEGADQEKNVKLEAARKRVEELKKKDQELNAKLEQARSVAPGVDNAARDVADQEQQLKNTVDDIGST